MSDSGAAKPKARRPAAAGALGLVLEQVRAEGFSMEKRPAPPVPDGRGPGAAAAARYFPSKGLARVPARVCRPWVLADRPETEFGHLDDVARSLKDDGQIQPAVVRVLQDPAHPELRYELIAGQVRWRAAMQAGVDLDVIVRELSDEAAFRVMVGENEFRRNLSDYARAMRLRRALETGVFADKRSLAAACGLSSSQLSYLLGFAELDPVVVARFSDIGAVSARLGYVINGAVRDGFREFVLRDLAQIEAGAISRDDIPGVWAGEVQPAEVAVTPQPVHARPRAEVAVYRSGEGRALFQVTERPGKGSVVRFDRSLAGTLDAEFWSEVQRLIVSRGPTGQGGTP